MRLSKMIVALSATGLLSFSTLAQDGTATGKGDQSGQTRQGDGAARQRRAPLTAEKAKAAWDLEAKSVAKELNLSGDNIAKIVSAYAEARESYRTSLEKARRDAAEKAKQSASGGDAKTQGDAKTPADANAGKGGAARSRTPSEAQKAAAEVLKTEQDKLKTALAKFLSEDQNTKAMASLGSFDRSWDAMVNTVAEFSLGEVKTIEALQPVQTYVVSIHKPRIAATGDAARTTNRQARQDLLDAMKKVLNAEQMTQFERSVGGVTASRSRNGNGSAATGTGTSGGGGRNRGNGGTGAATGTGAKGGGENNGKTSGG